MNAQPIQNPLDVLNLYEWEDGGTNFKPALQLAVNAATAVP